MHIASYIKKIKTAPSDTPNKNGSRGTFENNSTLQKWHMKNTPPKIDKYDT